MKAKFKLTGRKFVLMIPLENTPKPAKSGKSDIYAATAKWVDTGITYRDRPLYLKLIICAWKHNPKNRGGVK